jgi:hypothetical protein
MIIVEDNVKMWRCGNANVKMWRCENANVKMWRCENVEMKKPGMILDQFQAFFMFLKI